MGVSYDIACSQPAPCPNAYILKFREFHVNARSARQKGNGVGGKSNNSNADVVFRKHRLKQAGQLRRTNAYSAESCSDVIWQSWLEASKGGANHIIVMAWNITLIAR